ncbi:PLDc N-terminal domain-containing protein [Mucilaginibacter boryungensis]
MIFAHLFSLYFLIDVFRSKFKDTMSKAFWIVVLLFIPLIGSLVYMRTGKLDKDKLV